MTPREWLRMHIPRLRVHFGVIPRDASPLEVPGRIRRAPPPEAPPPPGDGEAAFRRAVLEGLRRIEARVERLCGLMERDRDALTPRHHGEVVNIGGGGLAFLSPVPVQRGDLLDLAILSPWGDPRPVFAVGEVRWVREEPRGGGGEAFVVGAAFTDIAEEDRDAILRTVFDLDGLRAQRGGVSAPRGEETHEREPH